MLLVMVSLWVVVAFFGVFFECGVPNPWAIVNGQCMNIVSDPLSTSYSPCNIPLLIYRIERILGRHGRFRHFDRSTFGRTAKLHHLQTPNACYPQVCNFYRICMQTHVRS